MSDDPFLMLFCDPDRVARYLDGPRRFTPGLDALHRMTTILTAERAGDAARVLILGAGGGSELAALAEAQPGWRFVGVDPAAPMLDLARETMGAAADRAELVEGYVDAAPAGPFDAAVCLLTLHFLDRAERVRTLRELHRGLRPGAPLVVAHASFPQTEPERARWLTRYAAYANAMGNDPSETEAARAAAAATLPALGPADDEACLREVGFGEVELFYAAFTWRGWAARA